MPKEWVNNYQPIRQGNTRYIPYCDNGWHQGTIKPDYVQICMSRQCSNLRLLQIPKAGELEKSCSK